MEFQNTWDIRLAELFKNPTAWEEVDITCQLLAQLGSTVRILGGFQMLLGWLFRASKVEAKVPVLAARHLYPEKYADVSRGGCPGYSVQNDASVYNEMDEEVTAAEFLARFQGLEDQEPDAAANGLWRDWLVALQLRGHLANAPWFSGCHRLKSKFNYWSEVWV